jgi:hypothetical protein
MIFGEVAENGGDEDEEEQRLRDENNNDWERMEEKINYEENMKEKSSDSDLIKKKVLGWNQRWLRQRWLRRSLRKRESTLCYIQRESDLELGEKRGTRCFFVVVMFIRPICFLDFLLLGFYVYPVCDFLFFVFIINDLVRVKQSL